MTIEATSLVELTRTLQLQGLKRICDVHFTRAPYRENHRWICSFD